MNRSPIEGFQIEHAGRTLQVAWVDSHPRWPRSFCAKDPDDEATLGVVSHRPNLTRRYWPEGVNDSIERAMLDHLMARETGWVATPPPLAAKLAALALSARGTFGPPRLLEPSAGEGALVCAAQALGASVVAVESDPGRAAKIRANAPCAEVHIADFLALPPGRLGPFDVVLMSPPFSSHGRARADIAHLTHAFNFLGPRGRLVAVMHDRLRVSAEPDVALMREFLVHHNASIDPLPEGSFRATGSAVKAVVVTVTLR